MAQKSEVLPDPSKTLIMKFGGTSVGSAESIHQTAMITMSYREKWPHLVIVVSAMRGITEDLLSCAKLAEDGQQQALKEQLELIEMKNRTVIRELFSPGLIRSGLEKSLLIDLHSLRGKCDPILRVRTASPARIDDISAFGERLNARLVAAYLKLIGLNSLPIDAADLIMTDCNFLNAQPLEELTRKSARQVLNPLLAEGILPVVTGFIGATANRQVTTLGRGGSDYTATILGASLDAKEVWIWTDVAGIMTADPRLVPEAILVSQIRYAEVHELANYGGRVLHPKTIAPVRKRNIPVRVCHTFDPENPGTVIRRKLSSSLDEEIIVSLLSGCRWDAENRLLKNGAGYPLMRFDGIDNVNALACELSVVSLVGKKACTSDSKLGAYQALDRHNIEVLATGQTARRNRFSLIIQDADASFAVRKIHNEVRHL